MDRSELLDRLGLEFGYDRAELTDRTTEDLDNLYRYLTEEEIHESI